MGRGGLASRAAGRGDGPGAPAGSGSPAGAEEARQRRIDLLSLLALGPAFQVRLIGQVIAAHAEPGRTQHGPSIRPALKAALDGRLALVAERWLGIDPDQVEASLSPSRAGDRSS